MPRRNRNALNRGRFQAQGNGLEESRVWSEVEVPTKLNGHDFIDELKAKLAPSELAARMLS